MLMARRQLRMNVHSQPKDCGGGGARSGVLAGTFGAVASDEAMSAIADCDREPGDARLDAAGRTGDYVANDSIAGVRQEHGSLNVALATESGVGEDQFQR